MTFGPPANCSKTGLSTTNCGIVELGQQTSTMCLENVNAFSDGSNWHLDLRGRHRGRCDLVPSRRCTGFYGGHGLRLDVRAADTDHAVLRSRASERRGERARMADLPPR